MLKSISWPAFLIWLSIITSIYYVTVLATSYRHALIRVLFNKAAPKSRVDSKIIKLSIEKLLEDLVSLLEWSSLKKPVKEEFIMSFQVLLRNYSDLIGTSLYHEINQNIRETYLKACSITLSDAEMKMLWNG